MLKNFVLLLSFCLSLQVFAGSLGQIDFFYSPQPNAHEPIIDAIDGAKKSIKMTMFHMSNSTIAAALMFAAKRGVDVQVIFDKGQWKSPNDQKLTQDMIDGGVKVVQATKGFSITHEKAMIIDGRKAMVSTMNMIRRFMQMVDYGVFTYDRAIIDEMESVFAADLQNAQDGTSVTPKLTNPYLIWSPVNSEDRLLKHIKSAKNEVELAVENINHPKIVQALIDVATKGVSVRVLTPKCNLTKLNLNFASTVALRKAGVDAKMYPGPTSEQFPYIHAKSIVVDHEKVYLGSINFTTNSINAAREVGIILPDEDTSVKVGSLFETLWKDAVLPPADENYTCATSGPETELKTPAFWTKVTSLFIL